MSINTFTIKIGKKTNVCPECLPLPLDLYKYSVEIHPVYNYCSKCNDCTQVVEKYTIELRSNPFQGWRRYLNQDTNFRLNRT